MRTKIISILLMISICLETVPYTIYAKENTAYQIYQEAMQATTASGNWNEKMGMTADMALSKDNIKLKTKAAINSDMNISGYADGNLQDTVMVGSADFKIMKQEYAWDVKYENGIAHYEYTKPDKTSADVKMDAEYFDFNGLTENMMENAKISNNKISVVIPAEKMENAKLNAIKLMPDIEDIQYGDVDMNIILDEESGMISEINMKFYASMTYQGYDTEADYDVEYSFTSADNEGVTGNAEKSETDDRMQDGFIIYSDYNNLSIPKESTITLSIGLIVNGEQINDISGITFQIKDTSILEVMEDSSENNIRIIELKGVQSGITQVSFKDTVTGYTTEISITVYTNYYHSYTLNSVPKQYIDNSIVNIYNMNGLYMDSYQYTINDDKTANITFDIYNSNYTYAILEIYDANGKLKGAKVIDKMVSNNDSIKHVLWDNVGYLIKDIKNGAINTYRQESGFSKKTSFELKNIPENGYIRICNNPDNSSIVSVINFADLLMSFGKLTDEVVNYNPYSDDFAEKLAKKLVEERKELFSEEYDKVTEKLWENVSEKVFLTSKSQWDFCNTIAQNLSDLKLDEVIADTAKDIGIDYGEELFKYFAKPMGDALNVIFAIDKVYNIAMQRMDLKKSKEAGSIYIQNQGGGFRASHQIKVESKKEFSDDTALNVFKTNIETDILDKIEQKNPEKYDSIIDKKSYTYNISLLEDGQEIQPDEEVTVYIPIQENIKFLVYTGKTKIYRVNEDGSLKKMDVKIEDGYFVFQTTHFSLYTVAVENFDREIIMSIATIIITILIVIRKKINHKKQKG